MGQVLKAARQECDRIVADLEAMLSDEGDNATRKEITAALKKERKLRAKITTVLPH